MPLLGAHQSIAGGYYRAVETAAGLKMDCVQIFTKNNNQWRAKPLSRDDIARFQDALAQTGLKKPCAHDSYLINLASPQAALWNRSLDAFVVELERAHALGLAGVVMHPGSYVDSSEEAGLGQVVKGLDAALARTKGMEIDIWVETTAGQGSSLGFRFEHIRAILEGLSWHERVGVCVDTCHIFAAGYPIQTADEYAETMSRFDQLVGLERIRAFHLNDSVRPAGSRVDRHAHIGKGEIGLGAFRHVLNDAHFAQLPMYLETPKGETNGKPWDTDNLSRLRRLLKKSPQPGGVARKRPRRVGGGKSTRRDR